MLPLLVMLLVCLLPAHAFPATVNVPSSTAATIQAGINVTRSGDTVLVTAGIYQGDEKIRTSP